MTVQAVTALAAAGVGRTQVDALLGYLGTHVDDVVVVGGADDPGALSNLILAVVAGGADPDLVRPRARGSRQPVGREPAAERIVRHGRPDLRRRVPPGARAARAACRGGLTNAAGVTWLTDQQCADGSWMAFRADTSVPCPPVDLNTFTGPDTNSTALAAIGLHVQGASAPAAAGVAELESVRNAQGGWGLLQRCRPVDRRELHRASCSPRCAR